MMDRPSERADRSRETSGANLRAVAIIASYNEERFIHGCLAHLREQGVDAYLCDNGSTDATVEIARGHLGAGLRGIETMPRDGVFRWRRILERKEELAAELDADWFLHLDPDEFPLPPARYPTVAAALSAADAAGCNAIEFDELTFVPTREQPDHDHAGFRRTMRWYYPFAPRPQHRVSGWKRQEARVDLATTGGHAVAFAGRRIWPERFRLCHYLYLSREHAIRKYVLKRYAPEEVESGWHGWRAALTADAVRLPGQAELRHTATDGELDASSPRTLHCTEWERE